MSFLPVDRRSLRFSLLSRLGLVALLVVGVTWLLHGILLGDLAREFLGDRLRQEARYTLERLERLGGPPGQWLESDSLASEVFHHLYVLRVGGRISSSHPNWLLPLEPHLDGPDARLFEVQWQGRQLLVYRDTFELDGEPGVLLVGEDFAQVAEGLDTLHWWVGGIAGLVLMLLILMNLVAVNRSLRPLLRLQSQLAEFQAGQRERLDLDSPSELDDLLIQLNHFMDELQRRLQRSREAVANLSHMLQTPLAAVTQVLRGRRPIDDQRRQRMLERLEDMQAQLSSELRRARFAGPGSAQHAVVAREAGTLIEMMRTLYPDKCFALDLKLPPEHSVAVERQDLNEMLGIVLDNAGKWARAHVSCRIALDSGQGLTLEVTDDGPGVQASALSQLGERGKRLDESTPGHGLGLAILKQIVAQYRGEVAFSASNEGGLCVRIALPC
ncbi:Signal transduction histidine kinase [Modicisalibacter ilicicola DSM 19980]|uniref:histidine kinase n=1 Tax=Modicisalibacter ilicicola DSM 19980 TaxID=1121942 RepID=A0A1M5BCR5_9GAMM|nr:ATP-binding protein [Halomonas ilicicola]SHF40220.1 Signal transduction histidine kinase [Halomonas ilicicola DSM 19980]